MVEIETIYICLLNRCLSLPELPSFGVNAMSSIDRTEKNTITSIKLLKLVSHFPIELILAKFQ